ncbi:MAG: cell division protein FtsL [Gammaproteobacteria bacterium]|nr:cell division protein FtsL [Gammaproteobacteria bacterium]
MNERQRMLILITFLFSLMLGSAILLVYSKHQSRKLFVEVQQMRHQVDVLNTEWSQLQLEQSAWSGHGRIERVARKQLSMITPTPGDVVFVKQ